LIALFAEKDERGDRTETTGERLVAAGVSDPANDALAAELFQIIGGVAGAVGWAALTHPGAMSEAVKPLGEVDNVITALTTARMRVLLRSTPPTIAAFRAGWRWNLRSFNYPVQ
jgi:hypothetical protein